MGPLLNQSSLLSHISLADLYPIHVRLECSAPAHGILERGHLHYDVVGGC